MSSGLAVTIDATGASAPSYEDILSGLTTQFQAIYGSDIYISADSQDGQLLAVFASAIHDCNQATINVYNSYSPQYAQGSGLSSQVKINGIARQIPTNSTANLTIIGQVGTIINGGIARDILGNQWALPSVVTIPGSGSVVVTGTAIESGNVTAQANTITGIFTPTLGWQTVNNVLAATPGAPVETDPQLRIRQSNSVSLPALSVLDSLIAAIGQLTGVQRFRVYENPTGGPDADGIPEHSVSVVSQGGDSMEIAQTIANKKGPGAYTYGSTSELVTDEKGVQSTINFYYLTEVTITIEVDILAQTGYVSTTGTAIIDAIVAYINSLQIGHDVYFSKLYTVANLDNNALTDTFIVTEIRIARSGSPTQANVTIAFNEAADTTSGSVTLDVS